MSAASAASGACRAASLTICSRVRDPSHKRRIATAPSLSCTLPSAHMSIETLCFDLVPTSRTPAASRTPWATVGGGLVFPMPRPPRRRPRSPAMPFLSRASCVTTKLAELHSTECPQADCVPDWPLADAIERVRGQPAARQRAKKRGRGSRDLAWPANACAQMDERRRLGSGRAGRCARLRALGFRR